jgi:chemotaxis protein MotB
MAAADKKPTIIIIKKKKGGHGGHHGGAWKVAYADFVTAMMAFFLVMWLMGADEATLAGIENYFNKTGSETPLEFSNKDAGGGLSANVFADVRPTAGRPMDMPMGKINSATTPDDSLSHLKEMLEETLSLELGLTSLAENMRLVYDENGFVLRLAIKDLFKDGSTEVSPDQMPILNKVGKVISKTQWRVRIEGHADPQERAKDHDSLWELSAARAAWVANYWTRNAGPSINVKRLQILGSAASNPIEPSASDAGRAANRRVEIIVLNQKYEDGGSSAAATKTAERIPANSND